MSICLHQTKTLESQNDHIFPAALALNKDFGRKKEKRDIKEKKKGEKGREEVDEAKEIGEAGGEGQENNHPPEPQAFRDFALQVGWWLQRKDSMT